MCSILDRIYRMYLICIHIYSGLYRKHLKIHFIWLFSTTSLGCPVYNISDTLFFRAWGKEASKFSDLTFYELAQIAGWVHLVC